MKQALFFAIILAVVYFSTAQCPHNDTRSDAEVAALVQAIEKEPFVDRKLKVLETKITESPKSLKASHVMSIIKAFPYIESRNKAMNIIDDYVLGLTCAQIRDILKISPYESERLQFLETLRITIVDMVNQKLILDAFTFSSNKEKAAQLLKDVKPRNCIFGTIKETVCTFAIDTSGSMATKFPLNNGTMVDRLTFVKMHLSEVIEEQLKPYQQFNIIQFESSIKLFSPRNVNATAENIQKALSFIRTFRANGGTNAWGALEAAFKQENLKAIYFLTDGQPNSDPNEIIRRVKEENDRRKEKVVIHTTAFLMGNMQGEDKAKARKFMFDLAFATNGAYRNIEQ